MANIDLIALEGEGYDPNELDPKPFDDTAPLNLVELQDVTL